MSAPGPYPERYTAGRPGGDHDLYVPWNRLCTPY